MRIAFDIQIDGEILEALEEYWLEEYEDMLRRISSVKDL